MRLAHSKLTVRQLTLFVALVGLALGVADAVRMRNRSAWYRRKAEYAEMMIGTCQAIDAMDAATRARLANYAFDDPFFKDPAWNHRMIPYFEQLEKNYRYAAEHPREPIPPDPPVPSTP